MLIIVSLITIRQTTQPVDHIRPTLTANLETIFGRGWLTDADWSPDAQTIAVSSSVGVWLYDADDLDAEPTLLPSDSAPVSSVAFLPDGKHVVEGRWDLRVYLWNIHEPSQPTTVFRGHRGFVNDVAVHPFGKMIASASSDKTIRLWDVATGETLFVVEGHENSVEQIEFDMSTGLLASYGRDNTIRLWDIESGELFTTYTDPKPNLMKQFFNQDTAIISQLEPYHQPPINTLTLSPDGRFLAAGTGNIFTPQNSVQVWDLETQTLYQSLPELDDNVLALAYQPDTTTIAIGDAGGQVYLWDYQTNILQNQWQAHDREVLSMIFVDKHTLVTGSADAYIRVWDANTGEQQYEFKSPNGAVHNIRLDASTDFDALDNTLTSYSVSEEEQNLQLLCSHGDEIGAVAFSLDNKLRAVASFDNSIQLVDVQSGDFIRRIDGHTNRVEQMTFSPDGMLLASGGWDNVVRIWDVQTGEHLLELNGHTRAVTSVVFADDGTQLYSASDDGTIRVWSLAQIRS